MASAVATNTSSTQVGQSVPRATWICAPSVANASFSSANRVVHRGPRRRRGKCMSQRRIAQADQRAVTRATPGSPPLAAGQPPERRTRPSTEHVAVDIRLRSARRGINPSDTYRTRLRRHRAAGGGRRKPHLLQRPQVHVLPVLVARGREPTSVSAVNALLALRHRWQRRPQPRTRRQCVRSVDCAQPRPPAELPRGAHQAASSMTQS